ncbi:hypothetical protein DPEC_G00379400, partial [Dallia pectoralis]
FCEILYICSVIIAVILANLCCFFYSGHKVFDLTYTHTSQSPDSTPHKRLYQDTPQKPTRRRKAPGTWWKITDPPENHVSKHQHPPNPKTRKVVKRQGRPRLGGSQHKMGLSAPQNIKHSLATFSSSAAVDTVRKSPMAGWKPWLSTNELATVPGSDEPFQDPACDRSDNPNPVGPPGERQGKKTTQHGRNRLSDNTSRAFESGPSSMIELDDYEENEDVYLPSSPVKPHQSVPWCSVGLYPEAVSQLCPPPLRAITLQPGDRNNLIKWLSLLWPVSRKYGLTRNGPDHFQWFSYQDRALGCRIDILAETFSSGTVLMGSYMKKPLLVDHYANTVYFLLTNGLTVTIDGHDVHYEPGQAFTVPCGHAYSLHNLTQEPAVLHFT